VTTPNNSIQEQVAAAEQVIGQVGALWVAAAQKSDSVEGLGADGRIQLVHGLVDLWVKGYVAWLEAFIKGGVFLPGQPQATEPLPSEFIPVVPRPYLRKVECVGPFVRVGLPKVTLQPPAFVFVPEFVPAGETRIRVVLKDYRLIGSNFTGKIKLTTAATATNLVPQDLVSDEKVVTVGL
jgi:hypothetical protein